MNLDPHYAAVEQERLGVAQGIRAQISERESKLATRMVVGNSAALVACFNAMISGNIRDWSEVRPFAAVFLFSLVCGLLSVALETDALDRLAGRLTLLGGAARRAKIAVDANGSLYQVAQKDKETIERISKNEDLIKESLAILESKQNEPLSEKWRRIVAKAALIFSGLGLGGALFVAVHSPALERAVALSQASPH